jgi:cytochrome c oxidase subunit 2
MAHVAKSRCMAATLAIVSGLANADTRLNLQAPVTKVAADIYDMHTLMLVICSIIFVIVFGVMFYAVFAHRKSRGHRAAQFHENTTLEIAWTIIPIFILLGMAWPATKTVLAMKDTSNPDLTVKVTGYQWRWGYDYLKGEGEGIKFISNLSTPQEQIRNQAPKGENYLLEVDNPLVVPVDKKVRILTTANDVIHSWGVPAFGVKQDAIPGFIRDTWFKAEKEGIYRGNCVELCGKDHGFMPVEVHVLSAEEYSAWVSEQKKKMAAAADDPNKTYTLDELKARGEKVYVANCLSCHQANGKGVPPAFPALDGSKVALGQIVEHVKLVLNGKPGTAMASFKQLNDVEIAAVVAYERNAWGNKAGDMLQPAEVKTLRAGGTIAAPAAPAPAEPANETAAPVGMPAKIYFEVGKHALPPEADSAIKVVVDYVNANATAKVDITGYTDKTGSLEKNLELAKERAKAVREALKAAGVAAERINMKPPATVTGEGTDREARRVEINPAG